MEPAAAAPSAPPARRAAARGMPFIMPDGRPLSVFLADNNLLGATRRAGKRGHGRRGKDLAQGWTSGAGARPRSAGAPPSSSSPAAARELSEAERAELAALEKVGQRRQRRWLNDKLLRDMAGPALTARDIESLFKPAPFGDTGHVSAFTLAATPEYAPLWDLFRSVDSDKEARVLVKWEAHVEELRRAARGDGGDARGGAGAALAAAAAALRGWAAVGPRGRRALRRAPLGCVQELEAPLLRLLGPAAAAEAVLAPEDGFQRLLVHALAEFHGLNSASRDACGGGGSREVVVRKRRSTAAAAATAAEQQREAAPAVVEAPRVTCVDVLWLLEDGEHGGGLSARSLQEVAAHHPAVAAAAAEEEARRGAGADQMRPAAVVCAS